MKLVQLAQRIGAQILTDVSPELEIEHIYAGDRISDLLNQAHDRGLLVSNLGGLQLIRVAELMDVPAICLVNGQPPDERTLCAAADHGTALLVSPVSMFETCGRLYRCLAPATKRVEV
ncbi:MAG: hypothetical protein PHU85_12415 [Phycisphaerae bacterium]|nr:hypothetical protein [Phycisphaerae bacterium]